MNQIEHISEPRRLFLAWQAPDHLKDRHRWAVGEVSRSNDGSVLNYYTAGPNFERLNSGRTYSELLNLGYMGYPAFSLKQQSHTDDVVGTFLRRLPPRSRSDYQQYAAHFRVASDVAISDFALLGLTEAKLPSDGFSLVDPLDEDPDQLEMLLDVAGFRYYAPQVLQPNLVGTPVVFAPEPANRYDPGAVTIKIGDQVAGYVNRLQAHAFRRWIADGRVHGTVDRINGNPERLRMFVFVRVEPQRVRSAA